MANPDESVSAAIGELTSVVEDLTARQFDQLVVFLVQELSPDADITVRSGEAATLLDLEVEQSHPFVALAYGIRLQHATRTTALSAELLDSLRADLDHRGLTAGAILVPGSVDPSIRADADAQSISLVDARDLAEMLIDLELGVSRTGSGVEIDEAFWELFRGPTRDAEIPSIEIPQADSLERLDQTLRAVHGGHHAKAAIAAAVEDVSGDTFDPRQADYYGTAGWLMGFLHKDRTAGGTATKGRWGLTRLGTTYLTNRMEDDHEAADVLLHSQIRQIEIIRRILARLDESGQLSREELTDLVESETGLGGTTVPRRTRTLVSWLEHLPEISVRGTGRTQVVSYEPRESDQDGDMETAGKHDPTAGEPEATQAPVHEAELQDEGTILDELIETFE